MHDGLNLDTSRFEAALGLVLRYTRRTVAEEFRTASKSVVSNLYGITPPAAGRGVHERVSSADAVALQRGLNAVDRDFRGVFIPVDLKGQRRITQVFGRPLATPLYVSTRDLNPNPGAIYDERNARRHGGRMTRGRPQAYYVDRAKLTTLQVAKRKHVGIAAAGLNPAARLLGVRIPSYARGHQEYGAGQLSLTGDVLHFRLENLVRYITQIAGGDMGRRLQAAFDYAANGMLRRAPHMAAAAARQAGFKTS